MMKRLIKDLLKLSLFIGIIVFVACGSPNHNSDNNNNERIKVVYDSPHYMYQIVEVDNHLYLANQRGGLVHLESCPCKR